MKTHNKLDFFDAIDPDFKQGGYNFRSLSFAFTGPFSNYVRSELRKLLRDNHGYYHSSVRSFTDVLVVSDSKWPDYMSGRYTTKMRAALRLGVKIISETAFLKGYR